ncbi:protein-disulfide reductase DsbD domain-containing protein [Luteolibacter sp. AS25]|uniref:protein-disulfide reductase DsbD domain-containing protein n=1 Tax=Luteolibacter sp. AS25 TaxID=3135776 RepID=UPI00398B9399
MIRILPVLALASLICSAEEPTKGVDLALVSSVRGVAPSSTFTAGLTISHHPGFHTYWKNPGAVGYPIRIDWDLPVGFTASEIRWPFPEISSMAGYPVFGYERDVTLLVDLTAPATLPDKELNFQANVSWMACSDSCFPGIRRFTLTLPTAKIAEPILENQELFSDAEKQIPKTLGKWKAELLTARNAEVITLLLTPPSDIDPGKIEFYSSDAQISSDPTPEIKKREDGHYKISARRFQFSPKDSQSLPFVIFTENPITEDGQKFGKLEPLYPAQ